MPNGPTETPPTARRLRTGETVVTLICDDTRVSGARPSAGLFAFPGVVMAVGLAPAEANAILNALCQNGTYTPPTAVYIKLHTGSPGAAGTTNAATETLSGTVTSGGSAYSLSGKTVKMYIKASATTADTAATVLSTATGEITVVSAAGGTYSVTVPSAVVATAGQSWYRVDVVSGSDAKTSVYGPLIVQDL